MFIVQFINTAVLIILVNANLNLQNVPENFPLFNGDFADFTVKWYQVVGSTIGFTMILNIFSPHFGAFMKMFCRGCKKCYDRRCSCDKRITRKYMQADYENVYLGPEF